MKDLLEYLNLCLEFINENTNEKIIDGLVKNIKVTFKTMTIEQIEGFESAFEALCLFYQKQINSIDLFLESLMNTSVSKEIQLSFGDKLNDLENNAHKLGNIVYFITCVTIALEIRKREIFCSDNEVKKSI